jgi:aminoglycoside phosphotransferase family enzyme
MTPINIEKIKASLGNVQLEESHVSWIILTEQFAYKIPKPVLLPYLDFSTLEKRKAYCEEEIRLNNRLTDGIYLRVVPIRIFNNSFNIEGTVGDIVEYAVKMKRLPEQRLMSRMLIAETVENSHIKAIADRLVRFHRAAYPVKKPPSIKTLQQDFADLVNVKQIIEKVLGEEAAGQLEEWNYDAQKFLNKHEGRMFERHQQQFYIHFHGDLHAANIFLLEQPVIFDCIAFNEDFSKGDILNELAFFCMDMDYYNRADLGHLFLQNYLRQFPCVETEEDQLIFYYYKLYRANIRLKVNALKWQQNSNQQQKEFAESISKYFYLMKSYTRFLFHKHEYAHAVVLPQHQ